jgi:preprotein translocase subunit SecA/nephrocystin-3
MTKSASFADNRQIRVFISSTFQDMEGERSYLINRTFPTLRDIASKRGVMLTELDLRWGITDEESKSGRVVDICFREIENSVPFFIGIIGNRYGWIPKAKDIGEGVAERFPVVSHYLDNHLSVTEMEMQFGVLERKENMHAFFYIKEPETKSDNPVMLRRLKDAVRASRYPSSSYSSLEDLGRQVEKAFVTLLDQLFPEVSLTGHQKERMSQQSLIQKLSMTYIKDQNSFDILTRFAEDSEHDHLVVTGDSGMGKSAFLANWAKENTYNKQFSIISFFLSNGGNQSSSNILNYLAEEISERCGLDLVNGSDEKTMERLLQEFSTRNEKLVIIIDAINQIADVKQAKRLNWLPIFPKNVKVIISTLKADATMEALISRGYPIFELGHLKEGQRRQLVEEYLSDNYGKHLRADLISGIVKDPQCENTLVLKTLLDEIICIGRHDILARQINYYLHSASVAEFYEKVIIRFEQEYGHEFVRKVLGLLAISRNGLTEQQIIRMAGIKPLDWSAFYCSFATHLNNQSGRLEFTHSYITSTVWHRYLENNQTFERDCRLTIANGLWEEQTDYALQEIPFQLDKLKDWSQLHDIIATHRYLDYCMDFDEVEIGTYWRHIFDAQPDKYTLEDYLNDCPDDDKEAIQFYIKLLRLCVVLFKNKPKRVFLKRLKSILQNHPEYVTSKAYRALSASLSGPEDGSTAQDALRYAQMSLEICRLEHDVPGVIQSLSLMGSAYYWETVRDKIQGSDKKAYNVWKEARDLSVELYGEIHPLVMDGYKDMALMCDDAEEALKLSLKAVDIGIMLYGKNHPLLGRPYHYVGCIYRDMKRWEEALHYFKGACRVWLPAYGVNHEIMVSSYGNQGKCLKELGRLEEALECYNTCLRILSVIYDDPGYDYALVQFNRARILQTLGRMAECYNACHEVEITLRRKNVRAEKRSRDVKKLYSEFRKQLPQKI